MAVGTSTDPLTSLERAVDVVCGGALEAVDEPDLTERLDRFHRAQSRLAAERARVAAELERRRTRAIDDPRDRERTRQQLRRELADRANRPPAQAKLDAQAGIAARQHPETGRAFTAGDISAEHVRLIAETLGALPDGPELDDLERTLLQHARSTPPAAFGRFARDLLARRAPVSVTLREDRQERERRVTVADTPDGGLTLSGLLHGTAAETVRTALDAFRRPDVAGELRSAAQRTADALEQLCTTALRAGEAPTRHGVRPQVLVTVSTDQLGLGEDGVVHHASGEATTLGRLRHLLDDCTWARVVLGPDGAPIEASESVRTVPSGLWRALLARDGGCTWPGCDAPASWCDVAHGNEPFAAGGRLSPDNAALLCRRHHRRFDHGHYRIEITGGSVGYHRRGFAGPAARPTRRPDGGRDRPAPKARSRAPDRPPEPSGVADPQVRATARADGGTDGTTNSPPRS